MQVYDQLNINHLSPDFVYGQSAQYATMTQSLSGLVRLRQHVVAAMYILYRENCYSTGGLCMGKCAT